MSSNEKKVLLAKTAGFCWGVKRAIDITMEIAKTSDKPVYTHGPLIHNPQVIETLEGADVYAVTGENNLSEGETIIIRTHGVAPTIRQNLKSRQLNVSDATCPLVAKVQGLIRKYARKGYTTIIIGDEGHAEVIGLIGFTEGRYHIIGTVDDVAKLPPIDNVAVVAQTTCDITKYEPVVAAILARYSDAVVNNTICEATEERQAEVIRLSQEVDAMVVVGGRNSGNTKRLAEIAKENGVETYLIETEDDLDEESVAAYHKVGVTAGASTPAWMIERVVGRIEEIQSDGDKLTVISVVRGLLKAAVRSNAVLAAGAAFMTFVNAKLAGFPFTAGAAYVASTYIFAMYVLNQLHDIKTFQRNEPEKIRFLLTYRNWLSAAAWASAIIAMSLAIYSSYSAAFVLAVAIGLGLGYVIKWFPKTRYIRIHRLKDIPASKGLFVSMAWVMVTLTIPALMGGIYPEVIPALVASIFTFTLVYVRTTLSDIRDIQGDRLVGRETVPIILGVKQTEFYLACVTGLLALFLTISYMGGLVGYEALALLGAVAYTGLFLFLYRKDVITSGARFDLLVDGVFLVAGLLTLLTI